MKLRHSLPGVICTLGLALAGQPVLAQSHGGGGGGSHGGGGGGGGSHAVPRGGGGGGGGSHPGYGGGAEHRHPQAGTGYHYGYGHGYYGHGHYYGGHPYYGYGYGYPYYGYGYYPYYWPGVSLSLGWGYGDSQPYYVYGNPSDSVGAPAPYGAAGEDDGGAAPPPAPEHESARPHAARSYDGPSGRVRLEVRPEDTSVYVDDAFHGTSREARIMNLAPGHHRIELVRPGFATEHRDVTVATGESQDVLVEMLRH